ncbi:MAG: GNAT family N-acetyltransferase [Chloroflexi bacterium]|nr:GNAT family N-acetyltransferase [Chloroflexota bacterium]
MTGRSESAAIEIRRATADDAPAVSTVYLDSFHATYAFPLAHPDEQVREWIRAEILPAAATEAWVATDGPGGPIVGIIVVGPDVLDQLYVAPDRLGQGIGRKLLERAKERSPDGLALFTFQVNDRARRFYERNGFVATWFGDGSANEEGQPDVRYAWRPARP